MLIQLSNVEKKNQRQEVILESLIKLEYATRSQLQLLHSLGSTRNANRVLGELGSKVNRVRYSDTNEWIYYLSKEGCNLVGCEKEFSSQANLVHAVMRNDMYLHFDVPKDWEVEKGIEFDGVEELSGGITRKVSRMIIPDARFNHNQFRHYLEVDNTQAMRENVSKMKLYKELLHMFKAKYGKPFMLVFYTSSNVRQKRLQEAALKIEIPCKVFTKRDII